MSFRQFGGLQFASKHNAVASYYNTSNNLLVTQNVGQSNSYINFLSDISGNQIFGDLDISGNLTAYKIFLTAPFHNYAGNEVVPKSYVDSVGSGLNPQGRVKVISSFDCSANNTTYPVPIDPSNITLPFLIDGVSIIEGENVLLNDQGTNSGQNAAVNNGVYTLNNVGGNYKFQRSTTILPLDASSNTAFISVSQGTVNSLSGWVQINDVEPNKVGTTPLFFSEYYSFAYKLGQGLSTTTQNAQIYVNVDSSLNFINYLDGSNNDTINIGTNTNTIKIGRLTGNNNKIYVNQNSVGINNNSPSSSYALDVSGILQVQDGTFQPLFPTSLNGLNVSTSSFYYAPNPATWTYNSSTIIRPPFKIELEGSNCLIYKATGGLGGSATIIQNTGTEGGIALASTTTAIYVNENGTTPGVGIMTSTPGYTLDVSGNINFTGSLLEDGQPFSGTTQWTTSGSNIYYNRGFVGMGTSTPGYPLDVSGNGNFSGTITNTATQPASSDSSTKVPTTAWVQSAISNTQTSFTITSNAVGTNSWNFTIPNNSYGRAFSYTVYSDTNATTSLVSNLGTTSITYGNITANGSFFLASGYMIYQAYNGTSNQQITYCNGYQEFYTYSASGVGYVPSIINSIGQSITWVVSSNTVNRNDGTCPPTASGGFITTYTLTVPTNVSSCNLKLIISNIIT
jgi:hypothetical protein